MPKLNIDELAKKVCEPIQLTVGGKDYEIVDISIETGERMAGLDRDEGNITELVDVMTDILGAKREDVIKLGMRRLMLLIREIMGILNSEAQPKNVPGVEATSSPK